MRPSQQVQVSEIQCLKPRDLLFRPGRAFPFDAIALTIVCNGRYGLCAALPLIGQPPADVLLRVPVAQAIQPYRPLAAWRQHSHIFAVGPVLYHIPLPPQEHQKHFVCVCFSDDAVNISANGAADRGLAVLLRLPFGVVLPFTLRRDSGQVILPAQGIRYAPHIEIVAAGTAVVFFAVHKGHGVHHHMIVQVGLIQVGADDHLVAVAK